jgi:hypothetical protein
MWYRATDPWLRQDQAWRPGALRPKAGTKWHLVDEVRSNQDRVFSICNRNVYAQGELRVAVLLAEPTLTRLGQSLPTPGHGATCALCYKRALKASGL